MAQPAFSGRATPSAEGGWAEALATAVMPFDVCQTSHLLAAGKVVTFGDDAKAEQAASESIVALAKGRTLLLSGFEIGRIAMRTPQAEAVPVLTAIMGTPKTSTQTCEVSDETWNDFQWGDFHVSFIKEGKAAVLDTWSIDPKGDTAANLKVIDDLPLRATFSQLKAVEPGLTQLDFFDTGGGPWTAEVRPNLHYEWIEKDGLSFRVGGGPLRACE